VVDSNNNNSDSSSARSYQKENSLLDLADMMRMTTHIPLGHTPIEMFKSMESEDQGLVVFDADNTPMWQGGSVDDSFEMLNKPHSLLSGPKGVTHFQVESGDLGSYGSDT